MNPPFRTAYPQTPAAEHFSFCCDLMSGCDALNYMSHVYCRVIWHFRLPCRPPCCPPSQIFMPPLCCRNRTPNRESFMRNFPVFTIHYKLEKVNKSGMRDLKISVIFSGFSGFPYRKMCRSETGGQISRRHAQISSAEKSIVKSS